MITRLLERGREHAQPAPPPVAQQLPLRFTRHQIALDGSNRPHPDTGPPPLPASTGLTAAGFPVHPAGDRR